MCKKTKSLLHFKLSKAACINNAITLDVTSIVVPVCIALLICSTSVRFIYHCHWNLRYRWYLLCRKRKRLRPQIYEQDFLFDAFLSYNKADGDWAVDVLLQQLEGQDPPLKLCVHERDFQIGKDISDNIIDSMEASRKIIFVISENFIKSQWCLFELEIAQHNVLCRNKDNIILIILQDVPVSMMSTTLRLHMCTRMSLKWTEDPNGQKLFWQKLKDSIARYDIDIVEI